MKDGDFYRETGHPAASTLSGFAAASAPPTPEMQAQLDVFFERQAQRNEFTIDADDALTPPEWIARLVKHVGRAVTLDHLAFRRAMVVVGAIALAAIEWHDRRYEP